MSELRNQNPDAGREDSSITNNNEEQMGKIIEFPGNSSVENTENDLNDLQKEINQARDEISEAIDKNLITDVSHPHRNTAGVGVAGRHPGIELKPRDKKKKYSGDSSGGEIKKGRGKKIVAGIVAGIIAVTSGVYGIGYRFGWWGNESGGNGGENLGGITVPGDMESQKPLETLTPEPTAVITPEPTIEPTTEITPEPTAEATLSPVEQENLDLQEKLELSPYLEGASKSIEEINGLKRVVYRAEEGNRFGVEVGDYMGEYKKEVFIAEEESGGMALVPKVAEILLEEAIEKRNEEEGENWLITMPVDISDMKTLNDVKLTLNMPKIFPGRPFAINIHFGSNESLDVINVTPGKNTFTVPFGKTVDYVCYLTDINFENKTGIIKKGEEMKYLGVFSPFVEESLNTNREIEFGDVFGSTSRETFVIMSTLITTREHIFDEIFSYEGLPVFLVNN